MKKILGLTIAIALAVGILGVATFAYFADTESSTGNRFTAGTLDLVPSSDGGGIDRILYADNLAPGDIVGPVYFDLWNAGSLDGSSLDISFSYEGSDGDPNPPDMSAEDTAAQLKVNVLKIDDYSLLDDVINSNGNDYKDIDDLASANLSYTDGIAHDSTRVFQIAVEFVSDTINDFQIDDFQGDGIELTMTFTLNQ